MSNTTGVKSNISLAADQILRIAHEVEAAEAAIKAEVVRAAQAGDCGRVVDVVTRWMTAPATEVLKVGGTAEHRLMDAEESR